MHKNSVVIIIIIIIIINPLICKKTHPLRYNQVQYRAQISSHAIHP